MFKIQSIKYYCLVGVLIMASPLHAVLHNTTAEQQEAPAQKVSQKTSWQHNKHKVYTAAMILSAANIPVVYKYVKSRRFKYGLSLCLSAAALLCGYNAVHATHNNQSQQNNPLLQFDHDLSTLSSSTAPQEKQSEQYFIKVNFTQPIQFTFEFPTTVGEIKKAIAQQLIEKGYALDASQKINFYHDGRSLPDSHLFAIRDFGKANSFILIPNLPIIKEIELPGWDLVHENDIMFPFDQYNRSGLKYGTKYYINKDGTYDPDGFSQENLLQEEKEEVIREHNRFKIHLQVKEEYMQDVLNRLTQLFNNNPALRGIQTFKVLRFRYKPSTEARAERLPIIVIYLPTGFYPKDYQQRHQLLNALVDPIVEEFKNDAEEISQNMWEPRFNHRINNMIWIAGGEGYNKSIMRGKSTHIYNINDGDMHFVQGMEYTYIPPEQR
jgi:hypothetical protein